MRITFTILLLFLFYNVVAQRIKYSPPESGYRDFAKYNIIGKVGDHLLIFINGEDHAEIAVYDDDMNKLESVPANSLGVKSIRSDFFTFPDHFLVVYQYHVDSVYFCSMLKGDGKGRVLEGPIKLDSVILPSEPPGDPEHPKRPRYPDLPIFNVLRSENKQWFMTLKGVPSAGDHQRIEATLYDKDFQALSSPPFNFSAQKDIPSADDHQKLEYTLYDNTMGRMGNTQHIYFDQMDPSVFSEFILDNDGDLVFIHSLKSIENVSKVLQANLLFKPHDRDSVIITTLSPSGVLFDDLTIRLDNAKQRYILTSLYYKKGSSDLTGLCSMIWDKQTQSLTSTTLTNLPPDISADARSDFSPPEQVLNYYFIRQVFSHADGGFLVLAELSHGFERSNSQYFVRTDFIKGKSDMLLFPGHHIIPYEPKVKTGIWLPSGKNGSRFGSSLDGQSTENILAFFMDPEGKVRSIKVIHKKENSSFGLHVQSYFPFIFNNAVHLMYNERMKGRFVPVGVSINGDGAIDPDPIPHDLNSKYLFIPRYGKQIGPTTCIIPCIDGANLRFARVDY